MYYKSRFYKNFKIIREARNLTQEQLATDSGLSRNFISLIELKKSNPTLETIIKLAKSLNIEPKVFFYNKDELEEFLS